MLLPTYTLSLPACECIPEEAPMTFAQARGLLAINAVRRGAKGPRTMRASAARNRSDMPSSLLGATSSC